MIELQSHSTVSDGQLPPAGVVEEAARAGVTVLALTDHDAVAGVPEAQRAADRLGIRLVVAVELSCVHPLNEDLHVLGYGIDLDAMRDVCERAQEERRSRAAEIVENLNRAGVEVTLADAEAQAGGADAIGRPHIAMAAGATDMKDFFERYLVPGAPTFVARRWPGVDEAVQAIHRAGGLAVFAHPFWDIDGQADVQDLVDAVSFDGVECFYPSHTEEQTRFLVDLCRSRGLLATGSSDYHGPTHKTFASFGAYETFGLGEPDVPDAPIVWRRGDA